MSDARRALVDDFINTMSSREEHHTVEVIVTYLDGKSEVFVIGDAPAQFFTWVSGERGLVFKYRQIVDRVHVPWHNVRHYEVRQIPTSSQKRAGA